MIVTDECYKIIIFGLDESNTMIKNLLLAFYYGYFNHKPENARRK